MSGPSQLLPYRIGHRLRWRHHRNRVGDLHHRPQPGVAHRIGVVAHGDVGRRTRWPGRDSDGIHRARSWRPQPGATRRDGHAFGFVHTFDLHVLDGDGNVLARGNLRLGGFGTGYDAIRDNGGERVFLFGVHRGGHWEQTQVRGPKAASLGVEEGSMRRGIAILVGVIVAVLAVGGFLLLTHGRARETAAMPPPTPLAVPVVAGTVTSGDVPIYLRGIGTVIAYNTVVVRSQIQGQITKITFTEGQTVKAGDTLAEIDPRPYQAQLDQIMATRDRDQAQLTNSLANLDRYNQLLAKGDATIQLADTQKAQVTQLLSAIKSDEALIEAAKVQLEYTKLTSPIDGVTGVRQVDVGNIIHPTDPNGLVVVTQIEPISVIFTLPETDLPQIQQQMAKGPLAVLAYSQDDTIKLDEGKLTLVDNEILQTTGTIRLKAEFPNPAHRLWPGELIDVWLLIDTRHNGLTVQASAVQQGQQGAFTYVINPDDTVAVRPVKVSQISQGQALIDSGLSANEQVVVDGQYKLQAGSHVTILHGKAAAEAAAQSAQQNLIP